MEHVVFWSTADGAPTFARVPSLQEAAALVEQLRNEQGISAEAHSLSPVRLSFRTYYHVEVEGAAAEAPAPALAPAPVSAPALSPAPAPALTPLPRLAPEVTDTDSPFRSVVTVVPDLPAAEPAEPAEPAEVVVDEDPEPAAEPFDASDDAGHFALTAVPDSPFAVADLPQTHAFAPSEPAADGEEPLRSLGLFA